MATQSLSVLGCNGSGKKTLIGNLIYKCGLGLPQLEELEREGVREYAEITSFYQGKGYDQSFHAPSGLFVVQNGPTPDVVLWVVDAADKANWVPSAQRLATLLSSRTAGPREKCLILVNKMDLVGWSEQVFEDLLQEFDAVNQDGKHGFVPVSGLTGENLLSSPQEHTWVNKEVASNSGQARSLAQPLIYQLSMR